MSYHSDDTEEAAFKGKPFPATTIAAATAAGFTATNAACDVFAYPYAEK